MQRVGFVAGSGTNLQAGGNLTPDCQQYGISITKLFCGSHYNLGCLFEVVLQNAPTTSCYLQAHGVTDVASGIESLADDRSQADGLVLMQTNAEGV